MSKQWMNVLIGPHVSEKSTRLQELGQYVFEVAQYATKSQVKQAVENLFNVHVKSVNLLKVKGKVKTFRFHQGVRKDWRKAYVCLDAGQTLDVMSKV